MAPKAKKVLSEHQLEMLAVARAKANAVRKAMKEENQEAPKNTQKI